MDADATAVSRDGGATTAGSRSSVRRRCSTRLACGSLRVSRSSCLESSTKAVIVNRDRVEQVKSRMQHGTKRVEYGAAVALRTVRRAASLALLLASVFR